MTAVVGILNKRSVAIAADSAATNAGSGKISNQANKIFTLSKYHPIGIMIHNNSDFMGTPWETIVKIYREQLDDNSFDTVKEYQEDFINFIHSRNFFCSPDHQSWFLNNFFMSINYYFKNEIDEKKLDHTSSDYISKLIAELRILAQAHYDLYSVNHNILPEFSEFDFDKFEVIADPIIEPVVEFMTKNWGWQIDLDTFLLLKRAYYSELIVKEFNTPDYTGLIFVGFGENEIFPSLIALHIFFGFDNKLRYFINNGKCEYITHRHTSAVATFAQSDVMMTILTGVAPELKDTYKLTFKDLMGRYDSTLLDNYAGDKKILESLIKNIDKETFFKEFDKIMDGVIHKKYITPLLEAVSVLSKEDMGEMAESLIYLTYLQRRITNAEESVGGPIDVAVISKGDGFIWLKRKHYFKPELNSRFFKNYFS